MKNIHLLSTDKPSRLVKINDELFFANNEREMLSDTSLNIVAQHIYITSDEEIKDGDWVYCPVLKKPVFICLDSILMFKNMGTDSNGNSTYKKEWLKKIVLTTDQDLIAEGVQSIDNEFLEWFVKNPSCEFVDVNSTGMNLDTGNYSKNAKHKIIIPQEESNPFELPKALPDEVFYQSLEAKQETLEEAAENFANSKEWMNGGSSNWVQFSFKNGAKWQSERSYSKEEVLQIYKDYESYVIKTPITEVIEFSKWFEQFKKK